MNKYQDGQEEGESITLTDSSNMNVVELSIAGNSKQDKREGYNILKVTRDNFTKNGITFTNNQDSSFTLNGTSTTLFYIDLNNSAGNRFTLTQNKKYFLYFAESSKQGISLTARISETTYGITVSTKGIREWVDATSDNGFAFMTITKGTTFNNETFYPMVAESDVEVPYEPYGAMPSPEYPSEVETVSGQANVVVSNKNILNFEEKSTSCNGSTITVAGNKIKFVGSETGDSGLSYSSNRKKVDLRKGTTITYSSKYISGLLTKGNTYYNLYGVNKDGKATNLINLNRQVVADYKTYKQATYTLQEDIKEIYIAGSSYSVEGLTELIYEFQLEIGDTATEIIEHTEQTKTVDIQQEMLEGDYFIKEEDGWKEVHGWNKQVLDGTEAGWSVSATDTNGINRFANEIISTVVKKVDSASDVAELLSNRFIAVSANQTYDKTEGVSINANGTLYIFCNACSSMDKTEFVDWLTENPVYIWYKLATPTKLACTEKQSAQLEDLLNTSTYKNVTHIYSTDKVSPIIKIKYRKDIETMLNNQQSEYETRLSNIEKLLSTTTTSALLLDNLQTDLEKEVM